MITFIAYGKSEPQGSARAFVNKKTGKPIITSDNPALHEWRTQVGKAAQRAPEYDGTLIQGAVSVTAQFYLQRPMSRPKREQDPDRKPDIDKLGRALLDALTGVLFKDDAQVCDLNLTKLYAEADSAPRVRVCVASMDEMVSPPPAPAPAMEEPRPASERP